MTRGRRLLPSGDRKYLRLACGLAVAATLLAQVNLHHLNAEAGLPDNDVLPSHFSWLPAQGWSEVLRITSNVPDVNTSAMPAIASEGSNVHMVFTDWENDSVFPPGNRDWGIYYTRSTDGGKTWRANNQTRFLRLNPHAIDREFGYAMSPTIAVSGSSISVAWKQNLYGAVNMSRIYFRRSLDSGSTWLNETIVGTRNDSFTPHILANGDFLHMFWTESNTTFPYFASRIYYSRSEDRGSTWTQKKELARTPEEPFSCGIESVAEDRQRLFLFYGCGDPRLHFFKRSLDNGQTWDDGHGNVDQGAFLFADTYYDFYGTPTVSVRGDNLTAFTVGEFWYSVIWFQILSFTSADLGTTWSPFSVVVDHKDDPSQPECLLGAWDMDKCGAMAWSPNVVSLGHRLFLTWVDSSAERDNHSSLSTPPLELFSMTSDDGGRTWGTPSRVTDIVEPTWHPTVFNADGVIHMAWESQQGPESSWVINISYMRFPGFNATPPLVKTLGLTQTTGTRAVLTARLETLGNYTSANAFFEWREKGATSWNRVVAGELYSPDTFEATISGLKLITTYEFRAGAGTELDVFGEVLQFTTWPNEGPPSPPVMLSAELTGASYEHVTVKWQSSADEGKGANDVVLYRVWRSSSVRGPFTVVANITATRSLAYSWTDVGSGHSNAQDFFYYVTANDSYFDSAPSGMAGKFQRAVEAADQLLSFPLDQANNDPSLVLRTISFASVRTFFAGDTQDPWKSHVPGRPYNDLAALDIKGGYWVQVTSPGTMTIAGLVPESIVVELRAGWNLIGFPSFNETYTFADFAAQVSGLRAIEVYDGGATSYNLRRIEISEWATTNMCPGSAYWVLLSDDQDWHVPCC